MTTRILTGITATGTPHLGNYAGAIRPAIRASQNPDTQAFFFLADLHALVKCESPERVQRSRLEIAATWIAAGLDTERATFYRQSDIPEISELNWLLTCVAAKGLLNRAHAYKAAQDKNHAAGGDEDAGITMGLFSYPLLMAADILLFSAEQVPVGRDQIQHVEMARDIAQRFNHLYGKGRALLTLPEAVIEQSVATLPGLDGRKMSKSYDNTIPLFASPKSMQAAIARIQTDSRAPGEPKDAQGSHLVTLYQAFASPEQLAQLHTDLLGGLAWSEAKQRLFAVLEAELGEARERYQALMAKPDDLEDILLTGAAKARQVARPLLNELRDAVGLRSFLKSIEVPGTQSTEYGQPAFTTAQDSKNSVRWVSFRDEDGRFRFRLLDGDGSTLLLSVPFADGKGMGMTMRKLQGGGGGTIEFRTNIKSLEHWSQCYLLKTDAGQDKRYMAEHVANTPVFSTEAQLKAVLKRLSQLGFT